MIQCSCAYSAAVLAVALRCIVRVDQIALEWHNCNQEKVRADLFSGVMDTMNTNYEVIPNLGRAVISNCTWYY